MTTWHAHSTKDATGSDWEPLKDHSEAVARSAEAKAAKFQAGALGRALGVTHDFGKYDPAFQQRLKGDAVRPDHSTAGAQFLAGLEPRLLGKLLAYAVAGHHEGLADGSLGAGDSGRTALSERLKKDVALQAVLAKAAADGVALPERLALPPMLPAPRPLAGFQLAFLGRMLFSCLVDADFIETERFYAKVEGWTPERGSPHSLADLRGWLNAALAEKVTAAPPTDVNRLRRDVLDHVRRQAERPQGVFTLTVPTGGGKTLASLAFALDHAMRHGLDRVIYVIPFTSIIEQTADVFRAALAPLDASVLEHHSSFEFSASRARNEDRDAEREERMLRLAAENWDAPVVVTTAVQFFESLFSDRPSRCRKLHNLAKSVIVLDEAQTLPVPLLKPCVAALGELARNYSASIVLCTATQPALAETDDRQRSFKHGFRKPHELAPEPAKLFAALKRVAIEHAGRLSDEELAARLGEAEQVLCIVNTRAHARELYDRIKREPGARHLSTLMCAAHRRDALAEIRAGVKADRPVRVVSTTLIEAGVDVDFPLVYRAEAGLDSIAQAAGRCNREGLLPGMGRTIVFAVEDDTRILKSLRRYADAARALLKRTDDPLAPDAIESYFREVYWLVGEEALDAHSIVERCGDGANRVDFPYAEIARAFRMIEDVFAPVIVPFAPRDDRPGREPVHALIARLEHAPHAGGIARKLQPYTVGVPERARRALIVAGAARAIAPERFGEQFVWLENADLYSKEIGLDWSDPTFRRAEGLFV